MGRTGNATPGTCLICPDSSGVCYPVPRADFRLQLDSIYRGIDSFWRNDFAEDGPAMTQQHDWPELPAFAEWQDTFETLHMWTQVVGKIRLALSPRLNHSWGCVLYATARGLTTSPIPCGRCAFTIDFDWVVNELRIEKSDGEGRAFQLEPMTVADFYRNLMDTLHDLNIEVHIFTRPVEVIEAIRFDQDSQHASYDAATVGRFWLALSQADRVLKTFRARFIGKASPVQFY